MSQLLELYTDFLIISTGQTSATNLSRMVDNKVSHDKVTRFLRESYIDSVELWKHCKPLVRQFEEESGVLIVDDCIVEKAHTDENALICWHWDHSKQRYVKGVNFLTLLYFSRDVSLPIGVTLVEKTVGRTDPKTGKLKYYSEKSKNEYFRDMLKIAHGQVKYRHVLGDSWFSSSENLNFIIKELKKDFVMAVECTRTVALDSQSRAAGKFVNIDGIAELKEGVLLTVYLRGVEKPLLLAKQVFTNKDGSSGTLYLISSDTTLDYEGLSAIYQKRWKVEEYHKSLKQNTSLGKSPTKNIETQSNHLFASMIAFIKLEKMRVASQIGHFRLKSQLYLTGLKAMFNHFEKLCA